jgi:hypothetical protein
MKSNVIKPGGDNQTKSLYRATLLAVIAACVTMAIRFRKKIEWVVVYPYLIVTVIMSWFWQLCHQRYLPDLERGVAGWMFHENHLMSNVLAFGSVIEDTGIFHVFGMLMGVLLALYVFRIFEPTKKKNIVIKSVFFGVLGGSFLAAAIFLDKSSMYSFVIFSSPGFLLFPFCFRKINIVNWIKYFISMVLLTVIWEFICNIIPVALIGDHAACWTYVWEGIHSSLYSNNKFTWLFGKLPVAIDIFYPGNGMIWLTGFSGYLLFGKKYGQS